MSEPPRTPSERPSADESRTAVDPASSKSSRPASSLGMAGSRAGRADDPPEADLWQGRTRITHFAGRIVAWGLLSVVATIVIIQTANRADWLDWKSAILAILATIIVSAVVILGRVAVRVLGTRYRVTSQRMFVHRGLLSQTIDQTELIRVDDVRIYKTVVDRLFGLGTIGIVSSDFSDGELRIDGVSQAEAVAEAIRSCARTLRQRAMYVESI